MSPLETADAIGAGGTQTFQAVPAATIWHLPFETELT
jgi:hypothetical protein